MPEQHGEVRAEKAKPEREIIAIAIFSVAQPGNDWEEVSHATKGQFLEMAEKAVAAAMPPLPTRPYPASLLAELAYCLSYKLLNPQHFTEANRDALDNYVAEIGEENVDPIVLRAVKEL